MHIQYMTRHLKKNYDRTYTFIRAKIKIIHGVWFFSVSGVAHHERVYKNAFDCFLKTLRSEGPLGLYKGFIPNWMRIGPHTIITFFIFEELRHLIGMDPV